MRNGLVSLMFLFLYACNKDNNGSLIENRINQLENIFQVRAIIPPSNHKGFFFQDISYGANDRNTLDILLPNENAVDGLVIFFHGGAFVVGDKNQLFNEYFQSTISAVLEENIAIVSANYTFLQTEGSQGVISALNDGADVISFITQHLSILKVPQNKIVLAGASAGAGISFWNGFREVSNNQIQGIMTLEAQSTYDLYEWENVFNGFFIDEMRESYPELNQIFISFYGGNPSEEQRQLLDYRSQMDPEDPPFYVYNQAGKELITSDGEIDFDVLYHSFLHGDYLRNKAIEVGLDFSGAYQELPEEFIIRMLQ
ncbi:MAG: hypothetical protein CMC79_02410 [Flavobacteriaceae bacterium]|nr:hypothetical protein [Flavobacteriaceae bacterium]